MWIEDRRRTPSSPPSSSVGSRADTAPRDVVSRQADVDVVDRERDVVDAVAVGPDVLGDLAVRGQRRREHEADVVLDHDVAGPVADLGLETAEGDRREAPQRPVVGRRLAGVADPELDVVDALERQEVGRLGVGVRVDPGAGLVGGALRDGLRHRGSPLLAGWVGRGGRAGRLVVAVHATPVVRHWPHGRQPARATPGGPGWARARPRPAIEAGAPWPMAAVYDDSDEARWGPGEVLAHLAEMVPYWLGEIERVARRPGGARAVRAGRDRRGAHRARRAGPVAAAARAVRPDRRRA